MNDKKPLILISNDDGFRAKGIRSLVEMIDDMADIIVCAPEDGRSGFSCAFSAVSPLRLHRRDDICHAKVWSCNGTPVDCVKLALDQLTPERKPDMVIGGINHGDNGSVNVHYSGTMGIVLEGCMKYIPSVGFSLCDYDDDADFSPMRAIVRKITAEVLANGLPDGVCLNVNCPKMPVFNGVRVCRMAKGTWGKEVERHSHTRGYDYYWMIGHYTNDEPDATDTDNWAIHHGYVAITPTRTDVTAYEAMESLSSLFNT